MLLTVSFFGTVIYATYTADLTTQMTIGHSPVNIKSFEDVHTLGKRLIVNQGGAEESLLENSAKDSPLKKMYDAMEPGQIIKRDCDLKCVNDILLYVGNEVRQTRR